MFGFTDEFLLHWRNRVATNWLSAQSLYNALIGCLSADDISSTRESILSELVAQIAAMQQIACDQGSADESAMITKLRAMLCPSASPSLSYRYELCEAEGFDQIWKRMHIDFTHGGMQRYRNAFTVLRAYAGAASIPDVVLPCLEIAAAGRLKCRWLQAAGRLQRRVFMGIQGVEQ